MVAVWHAVWMLYGCRMPAVWMPYGCRMDAVWMPLHNNGFPKWKTIFQLVVQKTFLKGPACSRVAKQHTLSQ